MDFPTSPAAGTIVSFPNGQSYRWNGGQWDVIMAPLVGNVAFPATQVPSSDPNTLDDYEEAAYNPPVTPGSGAFANLTSSGFYTKIGRFVHFQAIVAIIAPGTAATALYMGLPFPIAGSYLTCYGRESQSTGRALCGQIQGTQQIALLYYDNTLPIAANLNLVVHVTYATT